MLSPRVLIQYPGRLVAGYTGCVPLRGGIYAPSVHGRHGICPHALSGSLGGQSPIFTRCGPAGREGFFTESRNLSSGDLATSKPTILMV